MLKRKFFAASCRLAWRALRLQISPLTTWLNDTQQWPTAKRTAWRLERLGDMLEFAWNEVPFYRTFWGDHGKTFRRPKDISELDEYPILTKELFKQHRAELTPRTLTSIRHVPKCTGGSTSEPMDYFLDVDHWCLIQAFHAWGWGQMGYRLGDPVAVLAGGSLMPGNVTLRSRLRSFATRKLFLYGVSMTPDVARDYHARMERAGIEYIYGYPSIIYLFAKYLAELNLQLPRLKGVLTTAEMLLPHYRSTIDNQFRCRLVNNFGSNDGGVQAYEINAGQGFHYNDLQSVLQTTSPTPGGAGNLLITNLWNRSTPFIRYENGDIISLGSTPVSTSGFPLIASVQGRTADILTFSSGISLTGPALTLIFGPMKIGGWQIVQTGANDLDVRIRSDEPLAPAYESQIREILDHHLHGKVNVSIRRVDQLRQSMGGKLKPVWSEWPSPPAHSTQERAVKSF